MSSGRVLVTGGAGYIGSILVPKLLDRGFEVAVFDALLFGEAPLAPVASRPGFELVRGDLRDTAAIAALLARGRFDAVIHLAAISNDPSSELQPELTLDVNLRSLAPLMRGARDTGVERFLYASSASVYGVKADPDVTEELPLEPITLYARCKAEGEAVLDSFTSPAGMCGTAVRAATVCGWSPRMRLDLTVNILTEHAVQRGRVRVFGGSQKRPNLHIEDVTDFYLLLLDAPRATIHGRAFNVCAENATVAELAEMVRREIDPALPIDVVPSDDLRSYHLDAARARELLGFVPSRPLAQAVRDVAAALGDGRIAAPELAVYRNVEWMKLHPAFFDRSGSPA